MWSSCLRRDFELQGFRIYVQKSIDEEEFNEGKEVKEGRKRKRMRGGTAVEEGSKAGNFLFWVEGGGGWRCCWLRS